MAAPALTVPPFTPPSYAVGSGAQNTFAFAFPFWDLADVIVEVNGVALDPSAYAVTGFQTQAGALISGGYGSGQVVLNAPVANVTVIVDRFVAPERNTVYGAGQPLPSSSLNADLNRLIAMVQDLSRQLQKFSPSTLIPLITSTVAAILAGDNVLVADTGNGT